MSWPENDIKKCPRVTLVTDSTFRDANLNHTIQRMSFGEDRGMCYGHFHAIPIVAGFAFFEDYLTFLFILDLM